MANLSIFVVRYSICSLIYVLVLIIYYSFWMVSYFIGFLFCLLVCATVCPLTQKRLDICLLVLGVQVPDLLLQKYEHFVDLSNLDKLSFLINHEFKLLARYLYDAVSTI